MRKEHEGNDPERRHGHRSDHERRNEQQSRMIQEELERIRRARRITTPVERVHRERPADPESPKHR
jgi:hypothetical protein